MAQLLFLAGEDPEKDIWLYINSPGGSGSSLAIYDTMQYVEPRVGTICMGLAASMAAILLAGGAAGMRLSLPTPACSSISHRAIQRPGDRHPDPRAGDPSRSPSPR